MTQPLSVLGSGVLAPNAAGIEVPKDPAATTEPGDAKTNHNTTNTTCVPASKWAHLQAAVDFSDGRETSTTTPQVRRPYPQRFFMLHATFEIPHVPIFVDEIDRGQAYVLTPEISAMLPTSDRKWATIHAAVTSDDIVFFHYRRETGNDDNIWARTAHDVVSLGRAGWIRMTIAKGGGYEVHHPSDPTFCAKIPAWPADLDRALDIALNGAAGEGGQLITSPKHRVIASLLRRSE